MKIKFVFLALISLLQIQLFAEVGGLNFSADVTSGAGHLTVTFKNKSVGDFNFYNWSVTFVDHQVYNDKRDFVCTFTRPGLYEVRLGGKSTTDGKFYYLAKPQYIYIAPTLLAPYELQATDVTINSDGYITSCNVSNFNTLAFNEGNLKIPSVINGQIIKGIANPAVLGGGGVFANKGIIKLSLPNTMEYIGNYAFAGNFIGELAVPNGVTVIGFAAFAANNIRFLTIPPSVEQINEQAFFSQLHLVGLEGVPTLLAKTELKFVDNNGNPDIQQSRLRYIGKQAFSNTALNGANTGIIEGVSVDGLFIPPTVEEIGVEAFRFHKITNLAFGDGSQSCPKSKLKILRNAAFFAGDYGCISSTVVIPASIEIIESRALFCTVNPLSGGRIKFEENSSLHFIEKQSFGGSWDNYDPSIRYATLPTQRAANNTFGLWVNAETGQLIGAESDGSYQLKDRHSMAYSAAYVVKFLDNDGQVLKSEVVVYGNAATAPADPVKPGYIFKEWDVDFTNVTTDLTVTAQYTINSYTVTFNDWDGTALKTESVEYGLAATAPANPVRTGYTFTGWDVDFTNVTNDLMVTAQYSVLTTAEFTFHDNISIFPNPVTNGLINISGYDLICKVEILSLDGKIVLEETGRSINQIDVSGLKSGVYFVKVLGRTHKIIIINASNNQ